MQTRTCYQMLTVRNKFANKSVRISQNTKDKLIEVSELFSSFLAVLQSQHNAHQNNIWDSAFVCDMKTFGPPRSQCFHKKLQTVRQNVTRNALKTSKSHKSCPIFNLSFWISRLLCQMLVICVWYTCSYLLTMKNTLSIKSVKKESPWKTFNIDWSVFQFQFGKCLIFD